VTAVDREELLATLRRDLALLTAASARACEARARLPPGSSRERVETANARWSMVAEVRDLVEERIEAMEREAGEGR